MAVVEVMASITLHGKHEHAKASDVTTVLGIEPTDSHEFGDPIPMRTKADRRAVESFWQFQEERTTATEDDFHGMASLDRLVARFEAKAAELKMLSEHHEIRVWILASSDSSQVGFVIGEDTMRGLGKLSASFWVDAWVFDENEDA